MLWVHGQVVAARIGVYKKDSFPAFPSVCGLVDSSFLLRCMGIPKRGDIDKVGVGRIDDDPADTTRGLKTHFLPGATGVGGFIYAVTHRFCRADEECLPRSCPYLLRVRWSDRQGADGRVIGA